MGLGALIGAGTNLIGGWLANKNAKRQQDQANALRNRAMGYMQGAWSYDPMATGAGRAMQDQADMSLGEYRQNALDSLSHQYGARGLMNSSLATSSMAPGLEDAYHRQRMDTRNAIAEYIQRARGQRFNEAGQMANTLTGQANTAMDMASQYGQEAAQGFAGAGNAIGEYLAGQKRRRWLREHPDFRSGNPEYELLFG